MNITGEHVFNLKPADLWKYLMDPEVLAKITPGDTTLTNVAEDQYQSNSNIKIGPVKGIFDGTLSVGDKKEPEAFSINMKQKSKIGNAQGSIGMFLQELNEGQTTLRFDGKVKLSGMIARTGQRVLSGVANALTQEIFASLEAHIAADRSGLEEAALLTKTQSGSRFWTQLVNFIKGLFRKN